MRKTSPLSLCVCFLTLACASPSSHKDSEPKVSPDASSFSLDSFSLTRPDGWLFVAPDESTTQGTVVVLHGPAAEGQSMRASVEVSRRNLTAVDRKRPPSHILTTMVTELMQTFDGFEIQGGPQDVKVAGHDAGLIVANLEESLLDGTESKRNAQFYAVVKDGDVWIITCMGPQDGSARAAIDGIIGSIKL